MIYWGLWKEIEILPYEQTIYVQHNVCAGEWDTYSYGILRYKQIIWYRLDDQTL